MLIHSTLFLSSSGLFDFDLTLIIEAIFFIFLSLIITSLFLIPISKQLEKRNSFIKYLHYKSLLFIDIGYHELISSMLILVQENLELNRKIKFLTSEINKKFQEEINLIKLENDKKLLEIRSLYIYQMGLILVLLVPKLNKISEILFKKYFPKNITINNF